MSSPCQEEGRGDVYSYTSIVKFKVKVAWTQVCQSGIHALRHGQESEVIVKAKVASTYPHVRGKMI